VTTSRLAPTPARASRHASWRDISPLFRQTLRGYLYVYDPDPTALPKGGVWRLVVPHFRHARVGTAYRLTEEQTSGFTRLALALDDAGGAG
jgi:hypothetical protein